MKLYHLLLFCALPLLSCEGHYSDSYDISAKDYATTCAAFAPYVCEGTPVADSILEPIALFQAFLGQENDTATALILIRDIEAQLPILTRHAMELCPLPQNIHVWQNDTIANKYLVGVVSRDTVITSATGDVVFHAFGYSAQGSEGPGSKFISQQCTTAGGIQVKVVASGESNAYHTYTVELVSGPWKLTRSTHTAPNDKIGVTELYYSDQPYRSSEWITRGMACAASTFGFCADNAPDVTLQKALETIEGTPIDVGDTSAAQAILQSFYPELDSLWSRYAKPEMYRPFHYCPMPQTFKRIGLAESLEQNLDTTLTFQSQQLFLTNSGDTLGSYSQWFDKAAQTSFVRAQCLLDATHKIQYNCGTIRINSSTDWFQIDSTGIAYYQNGIATQGPLITQSFTQK